MHLSRKGVLRLLAKRGDFLAATANNLPGPLVVCATTREEIVAVEMVPISDDELARLAKEGGTRSVEARILKDLQKRRAKDRQAYAFRVGRFYFTGPIPSALTELAIVDLVAVAEWLQDG